MPIFLNNPMEMYNKFSELEENVLKCMEKKQLIEKLNMVTQFETQEQLEVCILIK